MRPPAWLAAVRIVPLGAAIAACGGPLGPAATAAPTTDAPSTATDGAPPPATGGPTDPSELPLPAFAIADPAGLPAWPTDRAGDRLAIAAVEVDLAMLIGAVQLRGHHVVLRSDQALRVSGRLAAGSRPDAIAALTALSARVGVRIAPAPPARRHRGRPLELAVAGSDPEDLVRPLSDVLGVDVVLPPGPFTPLDVAARDAPVDGVLDAVASALGLRAHRDRALIFLAPAAAPPPPRVAARGPRVFLDVADASLGETVDLLRALLPVAGGFACDAGARIHLRLRRVPLDQALVAIGHRRSVPVDPAAVAGCGTKEGDARALLAGGARLIGVALHGSAGAALLRRPDGSAAIVRAKPGGPLRIAEDRVALAAPNADGARPPPAELLLRTPPGERHDFLAFPGRWRVSATILEAGAPAIARLESIAGDARWIVAWSPRADQPSPTPGLGEVVIEASRVRITGAYGDAVELKLGRWDRLTRATAPANGAPQLGQASVRRIELSSIASTSCDTKPEGCGVIDVAVDLTITVADLAVIALLKMSAYIDRPFDRRHDLEDLGFLLDTYLTDDDERRYADEIVVRQLDFDRAAAFALGRDLASFASAHERALVNRFLDCARTNQHATLTLFAAGATSSRWRNDEDAASALLEDFRLGFDAGE